MTWSLLGELGVTYAVPDGGVGLDSGLDYPVQLERAENQTYLIVDEIGLRKNLTTLTECRTLWVDVAGKVLFDSLAEGMTDTFGCLAGDGLALLRRTTWELQLLGRDAEVLRSIDLARHTQHMPRLVAWTRRGTFLVASLDVVYDVDLVELDRWGNLLWHLPRKDAVGCPTGVQLLDNDRLLVADEFGHVVVELRRDGSVAWQHGRKRHPARGPGLLSNPMGARESPNGRRLISDTRNHRLVQVESEGRECELDLRVDGELCSPTWADPTDDGHLLVCDAGNGRVFEIDERGRVIWQFGGATCGRRCLSYPRSVELMSDGSYLVADTGHDRIVRLGRDGSGSEDVVECSVNAEPALFWPRCVRRSATGMIVADARNSRILELSETGAIVNELAELRGASVTELDDPHDVRLLRNGHLLITDAGAKMVVEADWSGRVYWMAGPAGGERLRDPHSAQRLADGTILVSDTGNGRLVWLDDRARVAREMDAFRHGSHACRFHRPRYAEVCAEGVMLVVDSGNNRILAGNEDGELRWELSQIPDSPIPSLSQPRWAQLLSADEVVVSDHSHHRILHLRRRPEIGE